MTTARILSEPRCYDDLAAFLAGRRIEMGLTTLQLDAITGLTAGYCGKALGGSQTKRFGWLTLFLLIPELGCKIQIIEDDESLANRRKPDEIAQLNNARLNNHARQPSMHIQTRVFAHIGRLGNRARNKKMTAAERSASARLAAMARWKKSRVQARRQRRARRQ
jgi:hypothetical protein